MHEFNLLIKQHIDYRDIRKQIALSLTILMLSCFLFHTITHIYLGHSLKKQEQHIDTLKQKIKKFTIQTHNNTASAQQQMNIETWLRVRNSTFHSLFKLQTEPVNDFCLTHLHFKDNRFIMEGNSSSAALLTDTLLTSRFMQRFNQVKIKSISEDPTTKLVRFKLIAD